MNLRTLSSLVLGLAQVTVSAMENTPTPISGHSFVESVKSWPLQDMITLKRIDSKVESSIIFFVPKNVTQVPTIGYSSCSCSRVKGLTQDQLHQEAMIALFKTVLSKLAAKGFKTVRFTAKLCQAPECLASFVSDRRKVPIIEQNGPEMVIATKLP